MKTSIAVLALGLAAALTSSLSQAEALLRPVPNREVLADPGPLLRLVTQDPVNARIEIVGARAELIDRATETLDLDLPGGLRLSSKQRAFEVMESGNEVWIGSIAGFEGPGPYSWARSVPLDDGGVAQVVEIRKRRSLQLGSNQDTAPASAEETTPCATLPPLHRLCRS